MPGARRDAACRFLNARVARVAILPFLPATIEGTTVDRHVIVDTGTDMMRSTVGTRPALFSQIDPLLSRLGGGDADLRFRAEVVLGIGALQILAVGLLSITELIWGTFQVGVVCLVGMIVIVPILGDLVRNGHVARAATRFMTVLYVISAILNFGSAGQTIGVSIALPSVVLVGALVLPARGAIVLFMAVVVQLVLVSAMSRNGAHFPINPARAWSELAIFRIPVLISISTAFIGLLVRRAMNRHRMELARTQQDLADSEKQLREIIEYSRGLICTHSLDGVLLTLNPASAEALGYTVGDLLGRNIRELVPEERKANVADYLARIKSNESDSNAFFISARDGEPRIWEYNNRLCTDINGVPYVLVNATDMTERRKLEEKLREQNIRDPLTGCFNRRFLSRFESRFGPDQRWGCVIVDLDNFKQVNDTEGHHRGDEILVAVGNFMNRHAGEKDAVVRMGGDEFLLLLPDAGAKTEAIAQRIRLAADDEAPCSLSIGFASRIDGEALDRTIERADSQLYEVRRTERRDDRPAQV